jgi:hypothetical protein
MLRFLVRAAVPADDTTVEWAAAEQVLSKRQLSRRY